MAYSRDALLDTSKRQERDKTRERQERGKRETREIWNYGGWPILLWSNKMAVEKWRYQEGKPTKT